MFPPPPFPPPPCIHPSPPHTLSCPHLNTFRFLAECVGVVQESHHHVASPSPLYTPVPSPHSIMCPPPPPVYPRPLPTHYHALTLTPSVSLQSV